MENLRNGNNILQIKEVTFKVTDITSGLFFKDRKINKSLLKEEKFIFKNGRIIEKVSNRFNTERKSISKYNDYGNIVEEIIFDKYDCKIESIWSKYDSNNMIVSSDSITNNNSSNWKYVNTQIKEDNSYVIKTDVFYKNVYNGYYKTFFDRNNTKWKYEDYDKNGYLKFKITYYYNEYKVLYKQTEYYPGSELKEILYLRNSFGDIIEISETQNFKTTIKKREYKYDRYNNWIEQKIFEMDKIILIFEREIIYR